MAVPFRAATFCLYLAGPTGFDSAGEARFQSYALIRWNGLYTKHRDVGNPYIGMMHDIITVARDDYALLSLFRSPLVGILYDSSKLRTRIDGICHHGKYLILCYLQLTLTQSITVGIAFALLCRDMKINIVPTSKFAVLCTVLAGALLTFSPSARAVSLQIGDSHELGFVNYGIPAGDQDRLNYVNHLIGMGLGKSDKADGQSYFRSNNAFGQLPQAVLAGNVQGKTTNINLGAGGLYTYLLAKYDGPNYGTEVWYVGNLSGVITIPAAAGRYDLSGWMLFGAGVPGVPDGGTTAMLLGAALSALGIVRRYIMS